MLCNVVRSRSAPELTNERAPTTVNGPISVSVCLSLTRPPISFFSEHKTQRKKATRGHLKKIEKKIAKKILEKFYQFFSPLRHSFSPL